mgnify:CR=1 FL=1
MDVVSVVVMVDAGDSSDVGMASMPPINHAHGERFAKGAGHAKMTAVMSDGMADLSTTCQMVCQRV